MTSEHALEAPVRTATIHCPRCKRGQELAPGALRHCPTCHGSWIPDEILAEHVSSMQKSPARLEWRPVARAMLPCAVCTVAMQPMLLWEVPVDRCARHGVWFDRNELAQVLRRSVTGVPTEDEPRDRARHHAEGAGVAADVAELGLEVGVEVAAHTALDTGIEAAGSGIIEGILDVIGGIFSAIDF